MQFTNHRSAAAANTGIQFPRLECWNPMTKVATVAADVNKQRVLCKISLEVLRDKFGASEDAPMRSVVKHRTAIQDAARKLIERAAYEADGTVLIRGYDL